MDLREPFSSPHGTPFKLRGFQPYQSRRFSVRIFTNFGISRFPFPPHPNSDYILFYFWRHRRPPRISLGAAGAAKAYFGGILSSSDFSRYQETVLCWVFPVTVFDEIQGNRCGIDVQFFSNPRFIQTPRLVMYFIMVGVSLG